MRRHLRRRGIEPDKCYWIAHAQRMKGRRRLDLRRDPPPDLAIEVDVTRSSLDRMEIYAALRVPEVWRLKDDTITFHVLRAVAAEYHDAVRSKVFPIVSADDLLRTVQRSRETGDQNSVLREFRAWIRRRLAKPGK